eukprot:scaffold262878_cov16-Attheya_sp.AAC.1
MRFHNSSTASKKRRDKSLMISSPESRSASTTENAHFHDSTAASKDRGDKALLLLRYLDSPLP